MRTHFTKLPVTSAHHTARMALPLLLLAVLWCFPRWLQGETPAATTPTPAAGSSGVARYHALRDVGIDPARVYKIRDVDFDREDLHFSISDGEIGLLQAVDGRVTGAIFAGDGEVLVIPPSQRERASLALFTDAAVLDEHFTWAFFRFDDPAAFAQLEPGYRALMDTDTPSADLLQQWKPTTDALVPLDALAIATILEDSGSANPGLANSGSANPGSTSLGPAKAESQPGQASFSKAAGSFLHAYFGGTSLGMLDVIFDTQRDEQFSVGRIDKLSREGHYDLLMSFPMRSVRLAAPQPGTRAGDQERLNDAVHISNFAIHTLVKPPNEIEGEAELTIYSDRGNLRALSLELSRYLKVTEARLDAEGSPAVTVVQNESLSGNDLEKRGEDSVTLFLLHPLPQDPATPARLRLKYSGPALVESGAGLLYLGNRSDWYPSTGRMEMAGYDLTFDYPAQWKLVATGKQVSFEKTPSGQSSRWVSEAPIPIAGFNLGKFDSTTVNAGGVAIHAYSAVNPNQPEPQTILRPSLQGKDARHVVTGMTTEAPALISNDRLYQIGQQAAGTLAFLTDRLGPLPFTSLSITPISGVDSQGWPGLVYLANLCFVPANELPIILARNYKGASEDKDMAILLYANVMEAHELAHQWWGDTVTWKDYHDQWLMEGLANYMALMQMEQSDSVGPRQVLEYYRRLLQRKNERGLPTRNAGPVTLGLRLNSSGFPRGYESIAYGRGTWLIHMIRKMLQDASPAKDDTQFLQALKALRTRYQGRQISTVDFQRLLEENLPKPLWFEGQRSLDWFFDGWVNGTATPKYDLRGLKFVKTESGQSVSGTLLQKDAPDTLVTSVPIYAVAGDTAKPVYAGRVFADGAETPFRLKVPLGTKKLLVDPMGTVLTEP